MLTIKYQTAFKKDYKRIKKRGYDTRLLKRTIELLAEGKGLPPEYRDHALSGDYSGYFINVPALLKKLGADGGAE